MVMRQALIEEQLLPQPQFIDGKWVIYRDSQRTKAKRNPQRVVVSSP
jgi:hypothetical protein